MVCIKLVNNNYIMLIIVFFSSADMPSRRRLRLIIAAVGCIVVAEVSPMPCDRCRLEVDRMTKDELLEYVSSRFSTDAEYPWDDDSFVFRHLGNRKWFAVAMRVPYARLGIGRDGLVDIVDVKCGPLLMDPYRKQPGILPGYHMNKDHWLTILLDGTADDSLIRELFEISFVMTDIPVKKRSTGVVPSLEEIS